MKRILFIFQYFLLFAVNGQTTDFPDHLKNTIIASLQPGDSCVYYQCHVEDVSQQLNTASGQHLETAPQKYSITEKFVIRRDTAGYYATHYVSSMIVLPNRRFSGLKLREKAYWNFKKADRQKLNSQQLKLLAAIELKGKEPTEYEFVVNKYNTNQIIIRREKKFRQLLMSGDVLISQILFGKKI